MRAVAALLVVGTHAAFATGYLTHGFVGVVYARLEVGVAIFFVLSGFLLFRPWVRATAGGAPSPSVPRYARRRVRRVVPAYVVTVIATFEIYTVFTPGPNPGQSWHGLLRHLTFTQVYTADSPTTILHPGLTQMWSMAVEVAFYAVLPVLAYLLLRVLCRGEWRPRRILAGLGGLALVSPVWIFLVHGTDVLPNSATMWLPAHLTWFLGGMALAVLQTHGARCSAKIAIPLALTLYLLVVDTDRRSPSRPGSGVAAGREVAAVCRRRDVGRRTVGARTPRAGTRGSWPADRWCGSARSPTRSSCCTSSSWRW